MQQAEQTDDLATAVEPEKHGMTRSLHAEADRNTVTAVPEVIAEGVGTPGHLTHAETTRIADEVVERPPDQ